MPKQSEWLCFDARKKSSKGFQNFLLERLDQSQKQEGKEQMTRRSIWRLIQNKLYYVQKMCQSGQNCYFLSRKQTEIEIETECYKTAGNDTI